MPNKRNLKLDDYGISSRRYQELKAFCLQYQEWRDVLKYDASTVKSKNITDMPICRSQESSIESQAMKRIELFGKCEMVEQTLIQAISKLYKGEWECLYPKMLKAIINDDINYAYLDEVMNIQCGRNTYYSIRRYFFFLLSEKRK